MHLIKSITISFGLLVLGSLNAQTVVMQYETNQQYLVRELIDINNDGDSILKAYYLINDTLAYQYQLYNNHPSGFYRVYHPNGKKKIQAVYINGKPYGEWKSFDINGRLIITGQYKNGLKQGSWYFLKDKRVEVWKNGEARGRWRINEGWTPWTLYRYQKGVLNKVKRHYPKSNIFQ